MAAFKWVQIPRPGQDFADRVVVQGSQIHIVSFSSYAERCRASFSLQSRALGYLQPAGSPTVTEGANSTNIRLRAV